MSSKLRFVWIDDSNEREKTAENLAIELDVYVEFVNVNKSEVDTALDDLTNSQKEPDLVILDHSLDKAYSKTYRTGSTAAVFIHEKWPTCPIISVTAVDIVNVDIRHRSVYEGMYPEFKIAENYSAFLALANGFKILKEKTPTNIDELLSKYCPPEDDIVKIKKILPKELKENFDDKSLLLEFYRWTQSVLFSRPGFLYDRKWAATFIGLNDEGFKLVEEIFNEAKYSGVFSDSSNVRWWKSKMLEIVAEKTDRIGLPWEIGRSLIKEDGDYFSKGYSEGEEFPETVAYVDTTIGAEMYPMKLKNTESHPNYEDMLYLEELRVMKPAE